MDRAPGKSQNTRVVGSGRWFAIVALGATFVGAGCSGPSAPAALCHADSDCADGERCDFSDAANRSMISIGPCPFTPCTTAVECDAGSVCGPRDDLPFGCGQSVCQPSCETAGCEQGDVCGADGLCTLVPCDEENGLVCPDRWHCAPGSDAVGAFGPGSDLYAQTTSSSGRSLRAGCVPTRCDQAGGFSCHELYECDPASSDDASGCAAISCADSGRCGDDVGRICTVEVDELGTRVPDEHDCVARTCLEGYECPAGYACDASSLSVTINGCARAEPASGVCVRD